MSKVQWKPGTLLYPVPPAMVTCAWQGKANVLTVAWTGITCSDPAMTYISVRPERYSYDLIRSSGQFVINLTHPALTRAADFCGVRSGRQMDKFAALHLETEPAFCVDVPLISQSPMSLECETVQVLELGSHHMFLAKILSVDVREDLLDEKGLHLEKSGLVGYAHGTYYALGKELGSFGYSVKKSGKKKA